ncbi:hypothetical protein M569_17722 [Genlisea aurea]|uniref:Uncharacterized protein n=1 Tax=Genlisea aurea TaxID=192259 RepID=S8DCL4_9LAMI|nr:hypothetical protein M569_17722 [Genlisea aurea]
MIVAWGLHTLTKFQGPRKSLRFLALEELESVRFFPGGEEQRHCLALLSWHARPPSIPHM